MDTPTALARRWGTGRPWTSARRDSFEPGYTPSRPLLSFAVSDSAEVFTTSPSSVVRGSWVVLSPVTTIEGAVASLVLQSRAFGLAFQPGVT